MGINIIIAGIKKQIFSFIFSVCKKTVNNIKSINGIKTVVLIDSVYNPFKITNLVTKVTNLVTKTKTKPIVCY